MAQNTVLVAKTGKTTFIPLTDDEAEIARIGRALGAPRIKDEFVKDFDVKEGKLAEEEWFKLELVGQELEMIAPWVDAACQKIDKERIAELDLAQVRALAVVATTGVPRESKIVISKTGKSYTFDRMALLEFDVSGVKVEERTRGIEMPTAVHAYFDHGKLYFKGFPYLSAFFAGADKYFREATDTEVNEFCGLEMFLLGEEFDANLIGRRQRKQIALALPLIPDFADEKVRKQITVYAADYLPPEDAGRMIQGDRLALNSMKDLGHVFHLLFGDYYTNELTGEKMIAKRSEKLLA